MPKADDVLLGCFIKLLPIVIVIAFLVFLVILSLRR